MNVYDQQLVADGRILHSLGLMLQREERPAVACAWCDQEAGRKPDPSLNQSHGMCPRHYALAVVDVELARQERAAA